MKKVYIVIDNLNPGGTQRQLLELLRYINRDRLSITVINLEADKNLLGEEIENLQVELINIHHRGFFNIKTIFQLIKLFRVCRPDIVLTYLFTADCYGRLAAKLAGVSVIISSVRSTDPWQKWYHRLTEKILAKITDKIIANADVIKHSLCRNKGIPEDKIEVVYNGIDLKRFDNITPSSVIREKYNIPQQAIVVGMVSRFSFEKDYDTFLKAAEEILAKYNCYFLAVGGGKQLDEYKQKIKNSPYRDRIIFAGYQKDIPSFINAMDICVLSSHHEGCPNVILEYMASGKPVVATDVGGVKELIQDGATGFLVPAHNAEVMADKIMSLISDEKLRKAMGQVGRRLVEDKFTVEKMVSNTEKILQDFTDNKIAFILSQFPEMHETFILREFVGLKNKGLNFKIFSLKRCKDKVIHSQAVQFINDTMYGWLSFWDGVKCCLYRPFRVMKVLGYIFKVYASAPSELVKALYVMGECFYLGKIIKKYHIYHIHSHWATMPTTAAVILNKLFDIPFSLTAHAWDIFISQRGLAEKIEKAQFCVTCTNYNKEYLSALANIIANRYPTEGSPEYYRRTLTAHLSANRYLSAVVRRTKEDPLSAKIYLNYHGIELNNFSFRGMAPEGGKKRRLLAIGRLVETKGFSYLIDACAILKKRGIDFECIIVGKGPLRDKLQKRIISKGLEGVVKLVGAKTQEEIKELLNSALIFIQPSVIARNGDRDGIPNVILEAMSVGVGVVASKVSGIPEVVIDRETGLLVPEKDSVAIADAVQLFLQDKQLYEKCIRNARALIEEKFDAQKNVEQLIGIFLKHNILSVDGHYLTPKVVRHTKYKGARIGVLYIIWSLGLGGAEQVVINLAKGIDKKKFNVIVCCLNDKGIFAQEVEKEGIEVIALGKRGKFDATVLFKLIRVIKKYKIDIVHTHLWGANTWGRIAAKLAGVKVVIATEHNVDTWKPRYYFWIDRFLQYFTDKIIVVSEKVKEFYVGEGISEKKIEVVHNGIPLFSSSFPSCHLPGGIKTGEVRERVGEEFGIHPEDKVLAIVGRLVEQKGHRYLFEALHLLNGRYKLKVLVIGEGPQREKLVNMARQSGIEDKVMFTGIRQDVRRILSAVDILVMPSLREGLPMALLEAMANEVAVIASNVGGVPEVIIDKQTGILVKPGDKAELAEAINFLLEDESLRRKLAMEGKKRVTDEFSYNRMVERTEELYLGLLQKKGGNKKDEEKI